MIEERERGKFVCVADCTVVPTSVVSVGSFVEAVKKTVAVETSVVVGKIVAVAKTVVVTKFVPAWQYDDLVVVIAVGEVVSAVGAVIITEVVAIAGVVVAITFLAVVEVDCARLTLARNSSMWSPGLSPNTMPAWQ